MTVTGSRTYDAPIAAVLAMLRDKDATAEKYSSQGHQQVEVLECGDHDGVAIGDLDFSYQDAVRGRLPCLTHRKL